MPPKKSINFFFAIIAIILAGVLYKQFDADALRFRHNGLAVVYGMALAFSVYFLIKNYRQGDSKKP